MPGQDTRRHTALNLNFQRPEKFLLLSLSLFIIIIIIIIIKMDFEIDLEIPRENIAIIEISDNDQEDSQRVHAL